MAKSLLKKNARAASKPLRKLKKCDIIEKWTQKKDL